jgi:GTP-binding nuclear protein Ran
MTQNKQTYKINLIGDAQSGKSSYITRLVSGDYTKRYTPTLGVEVHPLQFYTNYGIITFNVWDCAGEEKFGGLRDGYYVESSAALIFDDKDGKWEKIFRNCRKNAMVLHINGKCDQYVDSNVDYNVSARFCKDLEAPFLHLARVLTNHEDLVFVDSPTIIPPTIHTNYGRL